MLKSEPKYEEEPMDTGELIYDEYDEEGEIHSSGDEQSDRLAVRGSEGQPEKKTSIFGGVSTDVDTIDSAEELKKLERAKRFAIPLEKANVQSVNNESLSRLHKSLGIDKENERHFRFNAIHMRGTQDMSTEDVFEYFASFSPSYIEWINDVSCNMVWTDDISAARALLNLSKEIKNLDKVRLNADPFEKDLKEKDNEMECSMDGGAIDAREIKAAIPPGFWRVGVPSEKSSAILLRFATRSDRKQKNAERNSEYYRRYGNPHFGNLPGLVSNSLRSGVFKKHNKFPNISEANEDGERGRKKNPWGHLAQEWNEQDKTVDKPRGDIRSRISLKRPHPTVQEDLRMSINSKHRQKSRYMKAKHPESGQSSNESENDDCDDEDDDDEVNNRVKFPRMKMYADEEEKIEAKPTRVKLTSQIRAPPVEDLRNKIDRRKRNKEMLSKHYRGSTSRRHWNKFKVTDEDEDNDDVDDDDDNWALEQYADLRESLEQNKKYRNYKYTRTNDRSESEENNNSDNTSDAVYNGHLGHRSPLQIEIENDEYFENESDTTL